MDIVECECWTEPQAFSNYQDIRYIGVDPTEGRYGEVSLIQCKKCGSYWVRYLLEYEYRSKSGRYFMGLVSAEEAEGLTPEMAIAYLDGLSWYLYGGSYFGGKGRSSLKPLRFQLFP